MSSPPPVVLCLSGHDPSGGAGLQADIETLFRLGCHAATVVTCLTRQDSRNVHSIHPQSPQDFLAQAHCLLDDLPIAAVKIGLLGSVEIVYAVKQVLLDLPGIPVVLDPILAAGGGKELASQDLCRVLRGLLPSVTLLTPNTLEASRLVPDCATTTEQALALLEQGCGAALITGTHADDEAVIHRLYSPNHLEEWSWKRLPYGYHGSGCTLATAIAAFLAQGMDLRTACFQGQAFTWEALCGGRKIGQGQWFADRSLQGWN